MKHSDQKMQVWEAKFEAKISEKFAGDDPAHDLLHFQRVVKTAKKLCTSENAKMEIVVPAAWLHDFVNVAKDDPRRKQASMLSAREAIGFLEEIGYEPGLYSEIAHAIEAHSFSAAVPCETLEAQIVQDADRLDALGAIGLARCFMVAGMLKRPLYSEIDPFAQSREVDDSVWTIDHFYKKLFKIAETLQTASARVEGNRRLEVMKKFLSDLAVEIE
jgi:uncharacterized protein